MIKWRVRKAFGKSLEKARQAADREMDIVAYIEKIGTENQWLVLLTTENNGEKLQCTTGKWEKVI